MPTHSPMKSATALAMLALGSTGSVHAAEAKQRMAVGAVVVAPCTVEGLRVDCISGQRPRIYMAGKATTSPAPGDGAEPARAGQGASPAAARYIEVSF
ncbi:hypothetical protein [Sphingobium fuliginis]|uniref:Uncharacterized protein n=1 Tax=Sphingobium fuliginis ATCC 27551 TaxID=1208342 RepID=A0A5B8CDR5_SPHSA|nr:hypothetical protein [Sphingobium fuliginis]QDC37674.1 hypothetical protein FIL70_11000 [Sphingobium fuliginis ATCC 27551]